MDYVIKPIAYISTPFKEKFGIPRQSGRVNIMGEIKFCPEFNSEDAIKGIEDFEYLWLIFDFSAAHTDTFKATVRPPRLGGNVKKGVFATRSPFRPNSLGLSSVKLESVKQTKDGKVLIVSGVDLLDNTPIFDIKPYLKSDCHENAKCGFSDDFLDYKLKVEFSDGVKEKLPENKIDIIVECLKEDPRPSYQRDGRIYGMKFENYNVKFKVEEDTLTLLDIE